MVGHKTYNLKKGICQYYWLACIRPTSDELEDRDCLGRTKMNYHFAGMGVVISIGNGFGCPDLGCAKQRHFVSGKNADLALLHP